MCTKMSDLVEKHGLIGDEQFGFRRGRSTLDAIFVLSQLIQKAKKQRKSYSIAFLDISKVKISLYINNLGIL